MQSKFGPQISILEEAPKVQIARLYDVRLERKPWLMKWFWKVFRKRKMQVGTSCIDETVEIKKVNVQKLNSKKYKKMKYSTSTTQRTNPDFTCL